MIASLLLLLNAASTAAWTAPEEDAAIPPSANWTVDFAPDSCVVERNFGSGDTKFSLSFELWPLAETTQLILQGRAANFKLPAQGNFKVSADGRPL